MSTSTFDSAKDHLSNLLEQARGGALQLPDFQRGWVWDDDHIRDLLASVSRSFPIGTVMMLETGGEVSFRTRPLESVDLDEEIVADELVLDGQQRLTSLLQSLFSDRVVATRDPKKRAIDRWYYIDIALALDESADRVDAIVSLPADRMRRSNFGRDIDLDASTRELEWERGLFPLNQVFDHYEWAQGYRAHHHHAPEASMRWDEFEREVIQRFRQYQLPVIRLNKQTPKEAVCLVFEKVNTGGVSLTVFELLTATFAAVAPPEFELRADWDARRRRLHGHKVLGDVSATDFIQAITLMATLERRTAVAESGEKDEERLPAVSCKRRDMLRLSFEEYQQWADRVEQGFVDAARFLHREYVFETKFLPYGAQVVPLAAILTLLQDGAESEGVRSKLAKWYWCGVFGELYGSTTETRFARDLQELPAWIDGGPEPRTIEEANFAPERLLRLRTRGSAAYKGIYVLLLREGARDLRTGETSTDQTYFDESVDIHHIFPKKWCTDQSPKVEPERMDSIVNKTPLTAKTNRIIGGSAPSEYLRTLAERHGLDSDVVDGNLRSHLINPGTVRADDFDAFFAERQAAMLAQIERVMGKTLLSVPTEADYPTGEDDEGEAA